MHIKTIKDNIYNVSVTFIVGGTKEQVLKAIKKKTDIDYSYLFTEDAGGFFIKIDNFTYFIVLRIPKDAPYEHMLAHECFHVTRQVLSARGIESTDDSGDETYAYYLMFLIKELTRIYKVYNEKR